MNQIYRLKDFQVKVNQNGKTVILLSGSENYFDLLRISHPEYRFGTVWPDQYGSFDSGCYIYGADESGRRRIEGLLRLFSETVFIKDSIEQTFALDYHWKNQVERSEVGELINQAKTYGKPVQNSHRMKAEALSDKYIQFIRRHPAYNKVDYIIPVPFFGVKDYDLPTAIAAHICQKCNLMDGAKLVSKIRSTRSMKDVIQEEKFDNIHDAFKVTRPNLLQDKRVLLIDDIYQSGETLRELAAAIRAAGARVIALVGTKTKFTGYVPYDRN
jgi:predicted amidophosphoribosyltransferase